jgi:hypothetical protein
MKDFARHTSFRVDGMGDTYFPSGLYLLVCAAQPEDDSAPGDLSTTELFICGALGNAHETQDVENPWSLLHGSKSKARLFWNQAYFVCAVAHPSPIVARNLLHRAQRGEDMDGAGRPFPWQKLTPAQNKQGALIFKLSGKPADFVPGGPARYEGWLLYLGMPYARLPGAMDATRKLAIDLGRLKYPVGGTRNKAIVPYPEVTSEHDGVLGTPLQACIHRFQEEAREGVGVRPPEGDVRSSWAPLQGTRMQLPPLRGGEPGVVDEPTAKSIEQWLAEGVVRSTEVLVEDRGLWGDHRLWWRQWALEHLCSALGALYEPSRGSSFRELSTLGGGQAAQSKHKLGMAFDLNAHEAEPSQHQPFGVEADWVEAGSKDGKKTFQPTWLIYLHSSLRPGATASDLENTRQQLSAVPGLVRGTMVEHMGESLGAQAEEFLVTLSNLTAELVGAAGRVGATGRTVLFEQFFRETIRRFQWRENERDGGDVQEPVGAEPDARANRLVRAREARSWLNYSRLAHRLGLYSISARLDFARDGFESTKAARQTIKLRPGSTAARAQKATILDRIADGIDNVPHGSQIAVYGPDTPTFFVARFAKEDFDLDVLRDWIRRPSDDPNALPPAAEGMGYEDAGMDLKIRLLGRPGTLDAQLRFLRARKDLTAEVMGIGAAVQLSNKLDIGIPIKLLDVARALDGSVLRPVPKGIAKDPRFNHDQVWLRPRVLRSTRLFGENAGKEPDGRDPGRFYFEVLPTGQPLSLEWWHQELAYGEADWITRAEALGISREVLSSPVKPEAASAGPVWQGGFGVTRASNYGPRSDPGNAPRVPLMPVG